MTIDALSKFDRVPNGTTVSKAQILLVLILVGVVAGVVKWDADRSNSALQSHLEQELEELDKHVGELSADLSTCLETLALCLEPEACLECAEWPELDTYTAVFSAWTE